MLDLFKDNLYVRLAIAENTIWLRTAMWLSMPASHDATSTVFRNS